MAERMQRVESLGGHQSSLAGSSPLPDDEHRTASRESDSKNTRVLPNWYLDTTARIPIGQAAGHPPARHPPCPSTIWPSDWHTQHLSSSLILYIHTMAEHSHEDGHSHSHAAADHGHTHEVLNGPGSFLGREMPIIHGRDWNERAFTVGIGG